MHCEKAESEAKAAIERASQADRQMKREAEERLKADRKAKRFSGKSVDEGLQVELDYLTKQIKCSVRFFSPGGQENTVFSMKMRYTNHEFIGMRSS